MTMKTWVSFTCDRCGVETTGSPSAVFHLTAQRKNASGMGYVLYPIDDTDADLCAKCEKAYRRWVKGLPT